MLFGRRNRTLHLYVVTATNLSLRSSDSKPTQRRRTACDRTWWWWLWVLWAVVKSFHMGWWDLENHHRWYPFTITATTLFSYQGTCMIQHGCTAFKHPPTLNRKHQRPLTSTHKRMQTNKQMSKYMAPPNPQGDRPRSMWSLAVDYQIPKPGLWPTVFLVSFQQSGDP